MRPSTESAELLAMMFNYTQKKVSLKARLLLEDLSSDLLDNDLFDNARFEDEYTEVSSPEEFQRMLEILGEQIVRIRENLKIEFIERIAHFYISVKIDANFLDFIVFPLVDRTQNKVSEKIQAWEKFRATLVSTLVDK